jgi:uncharacterized membrane protein HdeD (DUF308 family)
MNQLMLGAIAMANLIIGLFFLRFWKKTRDRFFLFFAVAFILEGINRVLLGLSQGSNENEPIFYLVRLVSYVLILIAIVDKNRINKSQGSG